MRKKPVSIKVALISATAAIAAAIIVGIFQIISNNKLNEKAPEKISNTNYYNTTTNDIKGDIVNGNKSIINITVTKPEEPINKSDNRIQYKLTGISNLNLIEVIEKSGKIKIVNNSENEINIYYSGSIELLYPETNSYIYEGGYVRVKIRNNCSFSFEDFKILPIRANPKDIIEIEIQNIINDYINKNTSLVSQKILKCINL